MGVVKPPLLCGIPVTMLWFIVHLAAAPVICGCAAAAVQSAAPVPTFEALLPQLTLDESIDLLGGTGYATQAVPRLGIPSFQMADGPAGLVERGPSIAYGSGIGLAASWDVSLALDVGRQLGRDARSRGIHYLLGPGVNIYRAPMNGRNFEYFGEDPWLDSRIAVAYIGGIQEQGISATVKHFVGNNSEFARHSTDSTIDERTLREIYLPTFEAAVKEAHVGAVMSSYNPTNGVPMSANERLERRVLKEEWGFDGVLMSDWRATSDGVAAANAALDLEMPTGRAMNWNHLQQAVQNRKVSAEIIADKVRRQLRLADRFGWGRRTALDSSIPRYNPSGAEVARRVALEGSVLLKNDGNALPFDSGKIRKIAIIGPAAYPSVMTAGGSGHVTTFTRTNLPDALSKALGPQSTVTYARGIAAPTTVNFITPFSTDASDGKPGVTVETFDGRQFAGAPVASRVESYFMTSMSSNGVDYSAVLDALPPGKNRELFDAATDAKPKTTLERWTGWYAPKLAGSYTISIQNRDRYRLLVDGKLVVDSSLVPKAALRQVEMKLTAAPHKFVLEQVTQPEFGAAYWRVNVQRNGTFVDPIAKKLAAQADAAVVVVGFDEETEGEGADREFSLPPGQDELIREISALNPNTVVVLVAGGAVDVRPWIDAVRALLVSWYPGEEGAAALCDLITGKVSPSGHLPISWERYPADNPAYQSYYYNDPEHPDKVVYREGVFLGYRGYQKLGRKPQFPFGFGLSYATFKYSNLTISPTAPNSSLHQSPLFVVSFDIQNESNRSAADIAQIYVRPIRARVPRPIRELKAFARVDLEPGERKNFRLALDARSFAYFDVATASWRVDAGTYHIDLGRSSEEIVEEKAVTVPKSTIGLN